MFFDTHVHFDLFDRDARHAVIQHAASAGVRWMLAVGGSREGNRVAGRMSEEFPGTVYCSVGFDRNMATQADHVESCLSTLPGIITSDVRAIGETGLDFHYSPESAGLQQELFRGHLAIARAKRLPVIVHCREAEEAVLAELLEHASLWDGAKDRIGVIHSFTGSSGFGLSLAEAGYFISFSGIVTFKSASALRGTAALIPEDRLLIETDSPYLAPGPFRGQANEPAFVTHTAAAIAGIRGMHVEDLAGITTRNARHLLGLPGE